MTDAAAVGLGYSPPYQSSSSLSESEVEEVVPMHDSGNADDEGDDGDANWALPAVEGDGDSVDVAIAAQASVSAVTRSAADGSVSIIEVAQAVATRGRVADGLGSDNAGMSAQEASAPEDDDSREFTTEPQPSMYRSLGGVATVRRNGADATHMSDAEDDAEPGDAAQTRALVVNAADRDGPDATNAETESKDAEMDADAPEQHKGNATPLVHDDQVRDTPVTVKLFAPPADDDEAEFGDAEVGTQSGGSRDEGPDAVGVTNLTAKVKMEEQNATRPAPVDTAARTRTGSSPPRGAGADQSTRETPRGVKRTAPKPPSSITPRRSKRIKHKAALPPTDPTPAAMTARKKAPAKAKAATPDGSEIHFDVVVEGDDPMDGTTHLQCKYCGRKLMHRKGAPARHLGGCDAYKTRMAEEKELAIKIEDVAAHSSASAAGMSESRSAKVLEVLDEDVEVEANQASALLWLFGSVENADRMKTHYRRAPLAVAAPIERLHALVHEHLSNLDVPRLLETLGSDAKISLVVGRQEHVRRAAEIKVESTARAKELYELGLSLSFPPPPHATDLVVATLAEDLGLGRYGAAGKEAKMMYCRPETVLEWQFHRSECFVFVLQGSALWKLKAGGARHPLRCFHPRSRSLKEADDVVKVLGLAEEHRGEGPARMSPPFDDSRVFDDLVDDTDDVEEAAVGPGAVVYMPAGTWYEVETAKDAVWLEIHLLPMTYEQVVMTALRPLLWRSDKWRAPFFGGGAQDSGREAREQVGELLEDLQEKIATLTPNDVVPEYMLLDGEGDRDDGGGELDLDIDLRKRVPFRGAGKHLRIQNGAAFRVNPSAALLRADEIPHDAQAASALEPKTSPPAANPPSCALQKKPKRNHPMRALASSEEHVYVLHGGFGNDAFESKVRVKFRCSAAQAALVEWIRGRELAGAFSVDALKTGVKSTGDKSGELGDDAVKHVLRFLLCVGYVSQAKSAN